MISGTKITIWIIIFGLVLTACSAPPDSHTESAETTDPVVSSVAGVTNSPVATRKIADTQSPTLTINPIYTAIFRVATITKTPTLTSTPTITLTPTRTRMPTNTPRPTSTPQPSPTATPLPTFLPLINHVFNNVKVYYGEPLTFIFAIVGASEDCPIVLSGRGIFVGYPGGRYEWKDRNVLIQSGYFFVREDDPNIQSGKIDYIKCPSR